MRDYELIVFVMNRPHFQKHEKTPFPLSIRGALHIGYLYLLHFRALEFLVGAPILRPHVRIYRRNIRLRRRESRYPKVSSNYKAYEKRNENNR